MSEAIGIVRRIDDLGRVVIPKEIRRVFRIQEGDPLEVFVTEEGILLKKYSPVAELGDFAKSYAESLFESTNHICLICDRDTIIAVAGGSKKDYLGKPIGSLIEDAMYERRTDVQNDSDEYELCIGEKDIYNSYVIVPIIAEGESVGAVILASKEENTQMGQTEIKMAETAANFLAKQMVR